MSGSKKLRLDFTADIENLKDKKYGEEEAIEMAKKLRGEIEQQMEMSFEMIEENQNQMKDFLNQRQQEEEEQKLRTADKLKMLEDGMTNVEDDINDNVKSDKQDKYEEPGVDSKSVQDDGTTLISKDAETDQSGTGTSHSPGKGRLTDQLFNLDDIPDVIDSIKEDLIENMKMKLSNEKERLREEEENKACVEEERINNESSVDQGREVNKDSTVRNNGKRPVSSVERKLAELAKAVVENEIERESEADGKWNTDAENQLDNAPTTLNSKHVISNHRDQLRAGLLRNVNNIDEVPGISSDGRKELKDVYERMKNNYDNLAQMIMKDKDAKVLDYDESGRVMRCRELCRDMDHIEGILDDLNDAIGDQAGAHNSRHALVYDNSNDIDHAENTTRGEQASAMSLVAALRSESEADNSIYKSKQAPAAADAGKQLSELLEKKIDAEKKLNSKLENLTVMLGQESLYGARMGDQEEKPLNGDLEELSKAVGDLKYANVRLQKELDTIYNSNSELTEENLKLRREIQDSSNGRRSKDDDILQHIGSLEIPQWKSEKRMMLDLDELKKMMGDVIYHDILDRERDAVLPFKELEDYETMRLENRNLQCLLDEYKDNIENLTEELIKADVSNDIKKITKIDNKNIKMMLEELQEEAAKTEKKIVENGNLLTEKESILNDIVLEGQLRVAEEDKLLQKKHALEREKAEINKSIHEVFSLPEVEKQRYEIESRIRDIDKEIDTLGRELKKTSAEDDTEQVAETNKLEGLLEKLNPHVRSEKKMKIINDAKQRVHNIPKEFEVDEAINRKEELERKIIESSAGINKQVQRGLDSDGSDNAIKESGMPTSIPAPNEDYKRKLDKLKEELEDNMKELDSFGLGKDDAIYLREAVESLKASIEETDKDLEDVKKNSAKAHIMNEELAEIEKKIKYLTEMLDNEEKTTSKDEELDSEGAITQHNMKEKIEEARERLKGERERLEIIIESTQNLERERSISAFPDFSGFQKRFHENTASIRTEIEEGLDDVRRILNVSSDNLKSDKFKNNGGKANKELAERKEKLIKLNGGIEELNRDLKMIEKFEKEGETGELSDSDIEELIYKIDAIKVSIDRMEATIEEHIDNDGDAKTLEILTKRLDRMKESQDEAVAEMTRRKGIMTRDLRELMSEKLRIVSEMKKRSGKGRISSDEEKISMLELIEDSKSSDLLLMNEDGGDLRRYLVQRQKIADDYKDFVSIGGLTEEDGELLSTMIDSTEVDIKERLEEILSDCANCNDDLLYENPYLNSMLKSRSELQNALDMLENLTKDTESESELSKEVTSVEKNYITAYQELRRLAKDKIEGIDSKLERLNDFATEPLFMGNARNSDKRDELDRYDDNDRDIGEMVKQVKDEIASFLVIDKFDEDWGGITASLLDEINTKNEIDKEINKLFDEREELIGKFLNAKSSGVDSEGDDIGYLEQILNTDQLILDQRRLYIDEKPALHSLPTVANDDIIFDGEHQQEDLLKSIFEERDFTIRQLFALRTRESARRYEKSEIETAKEVSTLEKDLEERLEHLDERIKKCDGNSSMRSSLSRNQSPNVYAMMRMIDEEVDRLRKEVSGKKLFLYGNQVSVDKEKAELQFKTEDQFRGEEQDEVKEKIKELTEQREYLILAGEDQEDSLSVEEVIERKDELESALKELQSKLKPLERRELLENEIEELERETRDENEEVKGLDGENVHSETAKLKNDLDDVEDTIVEYVVAIENELNRSLPLMDIGLSTLNPDDVEQVRNVLEQRLDDLINERMKLDLNRKNISEKLKDKNDLQGLVNKRKDIITKLDDIEVELGKTSNNESFGKELHEKRQDYEITSKRQKYLEKKKNELQIVMEDIEQQKEASFEDTTSGFSDSVELDGIDSLKQEVESMKLLNKTTASKFEEEEKKVMELVKENNDKNETITRLEEELNRLQNEVDELNEAAEAMLEVANAMDEQNQAKSLEIELHKDEIKELKKHLKEAESRDGQGVRASSEELDAKLKEKSRELGELMNEKEDMGQEIESLRENINAVNDELCSERAKCMELEKQLIALDQLKDELKRKGKRILQIDDNELYTMSPTEEDTKDGRRSNDFKNEIDKVSAVEEIMRLAAEMTSENDRTKRKCNDLETQKEELAQILEDLLEKCQGQSDEIENLKKKIKEVDGANTKDIVFDEIQNEEDIVPMEHRLLMDQPEYGLEDDIDDLKTRVTILSNEKEQLKDEMEDTRGKVDELENDLKSKEEMLQSAENQIEELMGTVRSLFAKNEELTKERNSSIENKRRAENAELEKNNLEYDLLLKTTKTDHMSRQIADLEKELKDNMKRFDDYKNKTEEQRTLFINEKENLMGNLREKCNEISRLKSEIDLMKMNHEETELKSSKDFRILKMQLQEANDHCEELEKNFNRLKNAKEQMLIDYEKQVRRLLEEITKLRDVEGKLSKKLGDKEEKLTSMFKRLENATEELGRYPVKEMEEIIKSKSKEVVDEKDKRRKAEEELDEERNEYYRQIEKYKEAGSKREEEIEKQNDKISKLEVELQQRDGRIKELELTMNQFDDLDKQTVEDNEIRMIRRDYERKAMKLRLDLEEAQQENEILIDKIQKLKKRLVERDNDLNQIETQYQNEMKDMKKKLVENSMKNEKESSIDKVKAAELENAVRKYKKESLATSAYISELHEEKLELNKDLKGLEKVINQMKEKNNIEKKTRDLRIQDLETENEKLKRKTRKIEETLHREIEESSHLKTMEKELVKVRGENIAYKEKVIEMSENFVYKEKAERLENELKIARDDFEKLKNESVQVLKHSNVMQNEVKQVKEELREAKKEHKKEQKLLISNLEKEFRKKIEEIIKSNLQQKEKMLQMWDEERENWEAEMKEDLESSKYDLERQLRLQRMDMERSHLSKLTEVMNENNSTVNDLNVRLNELEHERRQMELKFDQEIKSAETQFVAEKEYMMILIRELLKSLVDSKSRKSIMHQNHKSEITDMEEKFEKEKQFMNMKIREELHTLRNKVNKMLSKGGVNEDCGIEELLDFIPRKL